MEHRQCKNCQSSFLIAPDDFSFYEKIAVPAPTWCPQCRLQRRLAWRNERSLHKRKCDAPGHNEDIISMYAPGICTVYDNDFWWGDGWDPMQYGQEYDFNKSFFQQYRELLEQVPLPNLSVVNSTNSEYSNWTEYNKNCYLVFAAGLNENVRFANKVLECRDTQDVLYVGHTELGYELVNCFNCYRLLWSANCKSATDSAFLYECRDCTNCFGCTNLIGRSYCLYNQQLSKDEYKRRLAQIDLSSYDTVQKIKKDFHENFYAKAIHRTSRMIASVNCTGNDVNNSKNCQSCFDIFENLEDSKYIFTSAISKEIFDCMGQWKMNFSYENVDNNVGNNVAFTITTYNSHDVRYCMSCHSGSNLFGCVSLRNKEYCILNKQYSKADYEALVAKIPVGEFFPPELSPFAYNETIAQEYFPLTKEQVLEKGYRWKEPEQRDYKIGGDIVACVNAGNTSACTTAFKMIPSELQFYERMHLPLPRLCPNCRHYARLAQRNPLKLWHRQCAKCSKDIETSFAPNRPEIVYCERCYQAEVM